jgi:6-phosphofructokinase 1
MGMDLSFTDTKSDSRTYFTARRKNKLNKIGVVTSGGDAPGINAAIRAIVRIAHSKNLQVLGFKRGWEGLITNNLSRLTPRSVSGMFHLWLK